MNLDIENCDEPIELTDCRVLAIIHEREGFVKYCGINIRLSFCEEPQKTKKYIQDKIIEGETIKCWINKDGNRIPADIHGGDIDKCYHAYINPTLFS